MNFPLAVKGHMPFVDEYKNEQIRKVLEKHRSRHHSGPDSKTSNTDLAAKHRNTHSMPILWQSVYAGQRPRFISMPALDNNLHTAHSHSLQQRSPESSKTNKNSIIPTLKSFKKFFSSKKDDNNGTATTKKSKHTSSGAIVHRDYSRPYSSPSTNKKPADGDIVTMSGGQSPKRQRLRTRTVSNISGVMETIEEVNEIMASTDHLSDSESSSSSSSDLTDRSVVSAPELRSASLLYSCSNLSNFSDSSSSHHGSQTDMICVS